MHHTLGIKSTPCERIVTAFSGKFDASYTYFSIAKGLTIFKPKQKIYLKFLSFYFHENSSTVRQDNCGCEIVSVFILLITFFILCKYRVDMIYYDWFVIKMISLV